MTIEKNLIISLVIIWILIRLVFMFTSIVMKLDDTRAEMYNCIANKIWCEKYNK